MKRLVALALGLVLVSGCGTTLGTVFTGFEQPYAGTRVDLAAVQGKLGRMNMDCGGAGAGPQEPNPVVALDLPLSFAADTALLPLTGTKWVMAQSKPH